MTDWPRICRSERVCPAFVRRNVAHGKAARHKSMVDASTAYNLFLNRKPLPRRVLPAAAQQAFEQRFSHLLAGLQQFRDVVPDLTVPASRATNALEKAAKALHAAGNAEAAQAADSVRQELFQAVADTREGLDRIVSPGWRLDAYRHRIQWEGPDGCRPDLEESILKSR